MGTYVNNGMVSIPSDHNFGDEPNILSELGTLMGVGKRSTTGRYHLADMCQTGKVNDFAKFKPQNSTTKVNAWPTEQGRKDNNWGMKGMVKCTTFAQLWSNATAGLSFLTHTAPWRVRDFNGYFHNAPKNVIHQMAGSKVIANAVFPDGVTIPFYILQKTGMIAQKALGTNLTGIDYSKTLGLTSAQLAACISSEDLNWDGETLYGTTPYSLGIVVFNADGTVAQKGDDGTIGSSNDAVYMCSKAIYIPTSTYDADMYIMQPTLALSKGTYKAVGAAIYAPVVQFGQEQTYTFLPLQSATGYSNKFDIEVSGAEKFQVTSVAVNGSTSNSIKTTANNVTVTLTIKNNSGKRLEYSTSHLASYINKWVMSCGISGSITTATSTVNISTSRSVAYNSVFSIAAGGTVNLSFTLQNIWSNSASTSPSQIESGSVTISPSIAFDGESLNQASRLITITYGV